MNRKFLMTRRMAMMGAMASLTGCGAVTALNSAATPLDTYDLLPVPSAARGPRSGRTLAVALPELPAAIASDRIMIKPDAVSVTYLPDARWSDELPRVFQSLLVRSISGTGRLAYVGRSEGGPIANTVLLARLDAFHLQVLADDSIEARADATLTLLDDRTQRVRSSRSFSGTALSVDDTPRAAVAAFQTILNALLPEMADWAATRA